MEIKIMDAIAIKEEKCKVLETKLRYTEKHVDDLLSEKAVTRSCISNIIGLLSDIIETRDPMISIIVKKHLDKKLCPVFAMLHRLEGVMKLVAFSQQGEKVAPKFNWMNPPKLQPTLLSSRKNPSVKKSYFTMNLLSVMKETKSLMKLSLIGGRIARQSWTKMLALSERKRKKKRLIKNFRPHSKAK
ncbi:unnamed protein product [Lactuca saligna]|uniref:Uncharacterized protein n=1 Tax=Lactuca saligna TaxID=75948 RepID=A0AA35Z8X7_LACSI|nr:unnamed protein product [Lactuca saligna]